MGNFSIIEALLFFGFLLVVLAAPIVLIVWAVRRLSGSRKRDAEITQRLEALEARDRPSGGTA